MEVETLIIGGGLMGLWTALFLSRRGRSVMVLEKGCVGAEASGVNFGNLRVQGRHPAEYPLARLAQEVWERTAQTIGEPCEVEATGHLYVAQSEEEVGRLETVAAETAEHGITVELRGPAETRARWPWLSGSLCGTSFSPRDGTANPRLVGPSVARAAQASGALVLEGAAVVTAAAGNRGFDVVTERGERFRSTYLVNAAGAWANEFAGAFGESAPMFAAGPPQFVTEAMPRFIGPSVQTVSGRVICRQVERGNVVVAGYPRGPSDAARGRAPVPPRKTLATMRRLGDLIPALRSAHVIRVWSGIEGYVSDMLPVLGWSRTTPRLIHAYGFCGHGFQLAPGVGIVVSEMICSGASPVPIESYDIGRFSEADWTGMTRNAGDFDAEFGAD